MAALSDEEDFEDLKSPRILPRPWEAAPKEVGYLAVESHPNPHEVILNILTEDGAELRLHLSPTLTKLLLERLQNP